MTDPFVGPARRSSASTRARSRPACTSTTRRSRRRSASGACSGCTPTSARRSRASARATSPPRSASSDAHRRHALRPERADRARDDGLPGAGDLGRDRAEDQGRRGEARPGAWAGWPTRIRRSGSPSTRRPARRSSRGWASSTWRSSSTGCCASSRSRPTSGRPQVAYRETIRRKAEAEGRYVRQTGGRGQYGHVEIEVEPREPGKGFVVREQDRRRRRCRGSSSRPSRRASGRRWRRGVLAGYPVVDVKVTLIDGSLPRRRLVRDGVQDRGLDGVQGGGAARPSPVLLEPIMQVEVVTPEEYMGDVIGDLSVAARPDRVGMEARGTLAGDPRARCRSPACSATRPTCAPLPRGAPPTRCSSPTTSRSRPAWPKRSWPRWPGEPRPRGLPLSERLGRTDEWPRRSSSGRSRT